jgi:hypothetical protein
MRTDTSSDTARKAESVFECAGARLSPRWRGCMGHKTSAEYGKDRDPF